MEDKKIKMSVSTFFLLVAIFIIMVMAGYIYAEKVNSSKEIANLEANADNMQNTIDELQGKIDIISNTIKTETSVENNTATTAKDDKYSEITETLVNNDVLTVTNFIKNNDGTYTLQGKIRTIDTSREQVTEYPPYKETGEYMQITVPSNTKCVYSVNSYDEKTDTVENVFSKKLYFGESFNFSFENGKCTSVYEVVTGH